MAEIDVQQVRYGPNPLYVRQGGNMFYEFDVVFDDTPPAEFDYSVELTDPGGNVVRTLSGTVPTNGESTVKVSLRTPMKTDEGATLPFGNLKNIFDVQAAGYTAFNKRICSGLDPTPEPCPTGR